MFSFSFNCACMMFLILISSFYFFKEKVDSLENKIYKRLIIVTFCGLLVDIGGYIMLQYNLPTSFFNIFISKLYLLYFLAWTLTFKSYIVAITKQDKEFTKISNISSIVVFYSFLCLDLILPLEIISEGNKIYSSGISVFILYFVISLYIIYVIVLLIANRKKVTIREAIPLITFLTMGIIATVIQFIFPEVLLITSMECFITCLMYFTIENPDVKMIEQLNIAREQADKANQAKTDFLSNMSHEIRTPLNAIVGFSQTLYEEEIPESAKSQVEDIISASGSLLEIVNGILDISKIEANKLEIINDEYSFKKVFDELVSLSRARMGDKPLDFRIHYDESIPKVLYGDKLRVKQVILNILTNSIKYTKDGFIDFSVNSVKKDNVCRLIISVEDSGVGIKKENLDKLFTKFQRFEEKNTTIEGTGLGLAITKKLVELMGGRIIVQSIYGKGSKFTIALDQRIILNPTKDVEESTHQSLDDEVFDLTGKKILIVDDNKLNLKVASKLLEKYKIKTELVESGFACLDKIKENNKYDIIFLDDMMPKMNGVATLKELKKIENFNTPVVILTANAISGMREKYISDGFDEYLAKPIERSELNRILKKFLM